MGYNETPTKGITMQHNYSYLGSPLTLFLEEKVAEGYNRFTDAFIAAQKLFKEEYGIDWTPELPLEPKCSSEDIEAYNAVGDLINLLVKINGGFLEIDESQLTSQYLVRV